jgi:hypothetical protein
MGISMYLCATATGNISPCEEFAFALPVCREVLCEMHSRDQEAFQHWLDRLLKERGFGGIDTNGIACRLSVPDIESMYQALQHQEYMRATRMRDCALQALTLEEKDVFAVGRW